MALRRRRTLGLAWWTTGFLMTSACVVMASACAKGSQLDESATGVGGAGGSADGSGSGTTSSTAQGTAASGATTGAGGASGASSSSSTSGGGTTSSVASSSTAASSSSGMSCNPQEHFCNGMCVGNTIDTGCYLSVACAPCPMPGNGMAICTPNGTCDVQCNMGYMPNPSKTDCVPVPMLMQCCDDNACPIFTICLDGYCKSPFDPNCDAARCNEFCKCTAGGTPQSTGMCQLNGPFWECACTP